MEIREKVIILDLGGNKSQSVARRVRKMRVYCEIYPANKPACEWMDGAVKGVIFIGGDEDARKRSADNIGGRYTELFEEDFPNIGGLSISNDASIKNSADLRAFISALDLSFNYSPEDQIEQYIEEARSLVKDGRVVSGLSGGVDSTVASVLLSRALKGDQLTCIFVDHGLMRLNEGEEVLKAYRENLHLNVIHVDASDRFLKRLKGVTDPETKRKIIGEEFIRVFEEEARSVGADFLLQGTIYPDIIESGVDGGATIKSHHNVGGIPEESMFDQAHIDSSGIPPTL